MSDQVFFSPVKEYQFKSIVIDVSIISPTAPTPPNANYKLLSSKSLSATINSVASKPVKDGLNAVPTTPQEKIDCAKFLTPQQQHQVVIGKGNV